MPLNRDPMSVIIERLKTRFEFRVKDEDGGPIDAHTPGTGYTEQAEVIGGAFHEMYGYLQWVKDQAFYASCDEDTLILRGGERGITRIDATFAQLTLKISGTIGAVIPENTVFQLSSGRQFRSTATVTLTTTLGYPVVVALEPGYIGLLPSPTRFSLVEPLDGLESYATLQASTILGTEIESIERYRARVLDNLRQPPMGGTSNDYKKWAMEAHSDVTQVFVTPHDPTYGIGSVVIRLVCEDLDNPIPLLATQITVTNYVLAKAPAGLRYLVVTVPTAAPANLVFTRLSPNTPEVQAAIKAEWRDLIRREYTAGGTTIPLSHVREAISRASGENDFEITRTTDFTYTAAQYPTWGNPTWPV